MEGRRAMEFLSDDWLHELDTAARAVRLPAGEDRLVVEQVVRDVPARGEVRYHIVLGEDGSTVRPGAAPSFDVRISTDYDTAAALARGDSNAQEVLARGRLRLGGDVRVLAGRAEVVTRLGDVFGALRARTEYTGVTGVG